MVVSWLQLLTMGDYDIRLNQNTIGIGFLSIHIEVWLKFLRRNSFNS